MKDWFMAWPEELKEDIITELLSLYEPSNSKKAQVGHSDFKENTKIRSSQVIGIDILNPNHNKISKILDPYVLLANREFFGFELNRVSEFQIAKYSEGDFFTEHMDMYLSNPSTRKISITVQLSDPQDYIGGDFKFHKDLEFADGAEEILRRKGTIIAFPSFLYHQITPITEGVRYSLVGWYEGSNWR